MLTMDKKNLTKGMYGYFSKKKKTEIIKTIVFFSIALAVYFTGLIHTGTNKNLLSIVAILGVLPAGKAAVGMIMLLRFKQITLENYNNLKEYEESHLMLYDLIFVLKEKAVKTECVSIQENSIMILTACAHMKETEIAKELKNFLSNHGKGLCTVRVFKDQKNFLKELNKNTSSFEKNSVKDNFVKKSLQEELSEENLEKAKLAQDKIKDMLLAFSM